MDVRVVLCVVKQDLVAKDNPIAFLSVLVPRLYLKSDPAGWGVVGEFQLLAGLVPLGALLAQNKELAGLRVPQLDIHAVVNGIAAVVDDCVLVVANLHKAPLYLNFDLLVDES